MSETGSAIFGSADEVRCATRWRAVAAEGAFNTEGFRAAKHGHGAWRGEHRLENGVAGNTFDVLFFAGYWR